MVKGVGRLGTAKGQDFGVIKTDVMKSKFQGASRALQPMRTPVKDGRPPMNDMKQQFFGEPRKGFGKGKDSKGKGRGKGKGRLNAESLDKQLEEYMGPDATKARLDSELEKYFGKTA